MLKAFSPYGAPIVGTLENIPGMAHAWVTRNADGTANVEFLGETDLYWNDQVTDEIDGETVFVDENEKTCVESEIEWREVAE